MDHNQIKVKTEKIRASIAGIEARAYFNTGAMGPQSLASILAVERELTTERNHVSLPDGEAGWNPFKEISALKGDAKQNLARLVNAEPEEIALVNSTTHGIYAVLWSMAWREGDEIITSNLEHFAVILPLLQLREKFGVVIRYFDAADLDSLTALLSAKSKLIAVSHVSYITGEVLPIEEIVRLAKTGGHHVPVLVDGAQSVGAIPVDVKALGPNYYSFPGQKWLLGPQGAGALFVEKSIASNYHPDVNDETLPTPYTSLRLKTDITRFEQTSPSYLAVAGISASVEWLLEKVGTDFAFGRIAELGTYIRRALACIPGVTVVTPIVAAGLTSFHAQFADAKSIKEYLGNKNIVVRTVDPLGYVRISASYFNTEQEADSLIQAVDGLRGK